VLRFQMISGATNKPSPRSVHNDCCINETVAGCR
jgi:hypothetical protein